MSDVPAVVFDLYGTLCDVHSVVHRCDASYPSRSADLRGAVQGLSESFTVSRGVRLIALIEGNGAADGDLVEWVGVFKPVPRTYTLACQALGMLRAHIFFVLSNAWDASGAGHFGFEAC